MGAHVRGPGPEHVGGLDHRLAVDPHRRQGVEALAAQEHALVGEQRIVDLELAAVGPVGLADPVAGRLVIAPVQVAQAAGGEQVQVHAARHGGGKFLLVGFTVDAPFAAEIEIPHRRPPRGGGC